MGHQTRRAEALPRDPSGQARRPCRRAATAGPSALVIWGTKDAYLPCEQAEHQRQAFPSAHVELLNGYGHWVMLEDPGRVASLVIPFLRRQLPGPATAAGSPASPPPSS